MDDQKKIFLKVYTSFFTEGLAAQLKPVKVAVFLTICRFMDAEGNCYPSAKQIADLCGVDKRTVQRAVKELLEFRFHGKPILTRELAKEGNQFLRSNYTVQPISQVAIFSGEVEPVATSENNEGPGKLSVAYENVTEL